MLPMLQDRCHGAGGGGAVSVGFHLPIVSGVLSWA